MPGGDDPGRRSVSPVTSESWEGIGVVADIEAPEQPLDSAYQMALEYGVTLDAPTAVEAREALATLAVGPTDAGTTSAGLPEAVGGR